MKCKEKRDMDKVTYQLNSRGRPMARGVCKTCGTKMSVMLGKDNTPPELAAKVGKGGGASKSRKSRKSRKSSKRQ
jgi:hypothetical protein